MRALATYRVRKHGHRMEARRFVAGTTCPVCSACFPTRSRALHHAQYSSKRCRGVIQGGALPELPERTIQELDEADVRLRRAARKRGVSFLACRAGDATC